MRIAWFASSLVSAYWNGAATYYRGLVRELDGLGHRVTFFEPDAYERQAHRDIADPDWADVVVYEPESWEEAVERARGADVAIKASGVGVNDAELEAAVLDLDAPVTIFWDVDAPATLARIEGDPDDPFRELVPRYDLVLTYGGGDPVVERYRAAGARECVPVYNALDPTTHHPVAPDRRFECDLAFLGNRLPDREARVREFFLRAAETAPRRAFLLGGAGWDDVALPPNVRSLGHVSTADHNALNCTPLAVLNVLRDSMAENGWSPATRVFEAAGASACLVTDAWDGIELFLEPDEEVLVARDGGEVAAHLERLTPERARRIGERARRRLLAEHTYAHRAAQVDELLRGDSRRTIPASVPEDERRTRGGARLRVVILGLSITSSWGNGHATNFRALVKALERRGHDVLFLERDVPWYAEHRDLPAPPHGRTALYGSVDELREEHGEAVAGADLVVVGSYVPDGVDVAEWALDRAGGAVAFYDIDTPVTLAALDRGDCEYLVPELIPRFDLYLSFTGGPTLDRLERTLGARRARSFYCFVDPDEHRPEEREERWALGYLGTYSDDRQPAVERLLLEPARALRELRFAVAGPQYPEGIDWPANVDRLEHLPPSDHPAFYAAQRFTVNVTRADMRAAGWSPSVRLFEAAACATPVISDWWDGLASFFVPGREILVEDALTRLREVDAAEARAIGEAARARVLREHTADHRVAQLEAEVAELAGVAA